MHASLLDFANRLNKKACGTEGETIRVNTPTRHYMSLFSQNAKLPLREAALTAIGSNLFGRNSLLLLFLSALIGKHKLFM